jgi:ATP-dependent helicase/nuclease subunit A
MGVLVDWPGESEVPQSFMFLASETHVPASALVALATEQQARAREELNALYVAMTRAKHRLVLSSVQPHHANLDSWWQRLQAHCAGIEAPPPSAGSERGTITPIFLPVLPPGPVNVAASSAEPVAPAKDTTESRIGQAMHRLLEWAPLGAQVCPEAQVRQAAREFGLDVAQGKQAADMAQRILRGQGAWAWDATKVAWHGNELALTVQGKVRRLDRLVQRNSGEWWVLDYKSAAQPQIKDELLAQLRGYRAAVQAIYPGQPVRAAFLSAQGTLEELEGTE